FHIFGWCDALLSAIKLPDGWSCISKKNERTESCRTRVERAENQRIDEAFKPCLAYGSGHAAVPRSPPESFNYLPQNNEPDIRVNELRPRRSAQLFFLQR